IISTLLIRGVGENLVRLIDKGHKFIILFILRNHYIMYVYSDSEKHGFDPSSDEPSLEEFQREPSIIDAYLQTYTSDLGLRIRTYPKLKDSLSEIWNHYYDPLRSLFDIKFTSNDRIIDIGAHHGFFAFNCARRFNLSVLCLEPNPINFEILKQTHNLNPDLSIDLAKGAAYSQSRREVFNLGK